MQKYLKQILILLILIFILVLPYLVFASNPAQDLLEKVGSTGKYAPYQPASPTTFSYILGTVVSAFLGLLGVIFMVLIIYAGYNWMTAEGEEEKVKKAKDTIRQSIIGLVLIVAAYAIWAFVRARIIGA